MGREARSWNAERATPPSLWKSWSPGEARHRHCQAGTKGEKRKAEGIAGATGTSRPSEGRRRDSKAPAAAAGSLISISGNGAENQTPSARNPSHGPENLIADPDAQRAKVTSNPTQALPPPHEAALPRGPPGARIHPLPTASPPRPSRGSTVRASGLFLARRRQEPAAAIPTLALGLGHAAFSPRASRTPVPPGSAAPAPPPAGIASPGTAPGPGQRDEDAGLSPGAGPAAQGAGLFTAP